jgi:hypothetical protein
MWRTEAAYGGLGVSEHEGCDWAEMTPGDFDRDAPLRLNVGTGPMAVPAEPDEYGTVPLFGEQAPARPAGRRTRRRAEAGRQGELF